jgi:hypothetical protein
MVSTQDIDMTSNLHSGKTAFLRKGVALIGLSALLAVSAASAQVASGTTGIDTSGNTQREKAACHYGMTQQDFVTCMREANNAAADKRSGKLDNAGGQFEVNALKRCEVLKGDDQIACEARIMGYGSTSGSVAGGGVVRQVETVVQPSSNGSITIEHKAPAETMPAPAAK